MKNRKAPILIIFKHRAEHRALKEAKILQSIQNYLFDDGDLKETCRAEFLKEPRITNLNVNINDNTTFSKKHEVTSRTHTEKYTITFSDRSTIEFGDLEPATLAKIKTQFNDKMQQLAEEKTLKLR